MYEASFHLLQHHSCKIEDPGYEIPHEKYDITKIFDLIGPSRLKAITDEFSRQTVLFFFFICVGQSRGDKDEQLC